ncbi:hypothetical protein PspLS_03334 [Pyricularia sp. CBS 133598]|nr:hypothetical protein PspLS_03334 [Pyricularia sp. CBS 133598]
MPHPAKGSLPIAVGKQVQPPLQQLVELAIVNAEHVHAPILAGQTHLVGHQGGRGAVGAQDGVVVGQEGQAHVDAALQDQRRQQRRGHGPAQQAQAATDVALGEAGGAARLGQPVQFVDLARDAAGEWDDARQQHDHQGGEFPADQKDERKHGQAGQVVAQALAEDDGGAGAGRGWDRSGGGRVAAVCELRLIGASLAELLGVLVDGRGQLVVLGDVRHARLVKGEVGLAGGDEVAGLGGVGAADGEVQRRRAGRGGWIDDQAASGLDRVRRVVRVGGDSRGGGRGGGIAARVVEREACRRPAAAVHARRPTVADCEACQRRARDAQPTLDGLHLQPPGVIPGPLFRPAHPRASTKHNAVFVELVVRVSLERFPQVVPTHTLPHHLFPRHPPHHVGQVCIRQCVPRDVDRRPGGPTTTTTPRTILLWIQHQPGRDARNVLRRRGRDAIPPAPQRRDLDPFPVGHHDAPALLEQEAGEDAAADDGPPRCLLRPEQAPDLVRLGEQAPARQGSQRVVVDAELPRHVARHPRRQRRPAELELRARRHRHAARVDDGRVARQDVHQVRLCGAGQVAPDQADIFGLVPPDPCLLGCVGAGDGFGADEEGDGVPRGRVERGADERVQDGVAQLAGAKDEDSVLGDRPASLYPGAHVAPQLPRHLLGPAHQHGHPLLAAVLKDVVDNLAQVGSPPVSAFISTLAPDAVLSPPWLLPEGARLDPPAPGSSATTSPVMKRCTLSSVKILPLPPPSCTAHEASSGLRTAQISSTLAFGLSCNRVLKRGMRKVAPTPPVTMSTRSKFGPARLGKCCAAP